MLGTRNTKYFRFAVIFFFTLIFFLIITRQNISETVQIYDDDYDNIINNNNQEDYQINLLESPQKNLTELHHQDQFIDDDFLLFDQFEKAQLEQVENSVDEETMNNNNNDDDHEEFDDSMPGAYLKEAIPAPTNQSYCKFNNDLPYDLIYNSKNYVSPPQMGTNSLYKIIYNVIEAYNIENVTSLTYATHMTANYAYFIPELLRRWEGLISVAAFVPDLDTAFFLEQITQFCYCEPEMHRVSIHIVTHKQYPFSKKDVNFFRPENCLIQDSLKISTFKDFDDTIIYPINVLRNAARTSAITKYILLADVEMMPSKGLASKFLDMVSKYNKTNSTKEVFAVPLFEVEKGDSLPENKNELVQLIEINSAIYFHSSICVHCQKFPNMSEWIRRPREEEVNSEEIKPFITIKRQNEFLHWEPIFIGTNEEPLYTERLSWEGLHDKKIQSLEMCLQDYSYTVLDNAFLCHWPGIRRTSFLDEKWRESYIEENQIVYTEIVGELLNKNYKNSAICNITSEPRNTSSSTN